MQVTSHQKSTANVPFQERLSCSVSDACLALGCGRTKLYELIAQGTLQTVRIGNRRMIKISSLLALTSR